MPLPLPLLSPSASHPCPDDHNYTCASQNFPFRVLSRNSENDHNKISYRLQIVRKNTTHLTRSHEIAWKVNKLMGWRRSFRKKKLKYFKTFLSCLPQHPTEICLIVQHPIGCIKTTALLGKKSIWYSLRWELNILQQCVCACVCVYTIFIVY